MPGDENRLTRRVRLEALELGGDARASTDRAPENPAWTQPGNPVTVIGSAWKSSTQSRTDGGLLKSSGIVPRNARTMPSAINPTRQPSIECGPAVNTVGESTKPAPVI